MNLKPRISASRKEVGSVDSSASLNANEYRCEVRVMIEGMFVTTHAFVVCAMKHRNAVLVMDAFILKMEGQTSKYRQESKVTTVANAFRCYQSVSYVTMEGVVGCIGTGIGTGVGTSR